MVRSTGPPEISGMTANKTEVIDPRIERIVQSYLERKINRRVFFERLIAVTGAYPLAHHLLETSGMAMSVLSQAESAALDVESTAVKYPGEKATLEGYLSRPREAGPYPTVIVIHENRGLNDHIRDVARRLASQGYVALAVDMLSRQGGTASMPDPDAARSVFRDIADQAVVRDLNAAYDYLQAHVMVRQGRTGVIGFCWGGQRSFLYATANPNLKAAVVFYGSSPDQDALSGIQAPVLANYGETDQRVTSGVAATEAAMKRLGKSYDYKIYPGAGHAFFNDTGPRYDSAAAADAWSRTLAFFKQNLA